MLEYCGKQYYTLESESLVLCVVFVTLWLSKAFYVYGFLNIAIKFAKLK